MLPCEHIFVQSVVSEVMKIQFIVENELFSTKENNDEMRHDQRYRGMTFKLNG